MTDPARHSTAREHAIIASELLASLERLEQRLKDISADEHLQIAASGGFDRINRNIAHTVALAGAHAQTAIALAATDD